MTVVDAPSALALGLAHQIATADDLDMAVEETVRQLLAGGPQALGEIKALLSQLAEGPVTAEVRELTAETISRVRGTAEAREGFAAFMEKRPASWTPPVD
jgi:methylglutaconyl-CoA hydratase